MGLPSASFLWNRIINVDDNPNTTAYAVISGIVSNAIGTAGIDKTGAEKLILSGSNSYNGATTVDAGTLTYATLNAVTGGAYAVHGGTLDFTTYSKADGTHTLSNIACNGSILVGNAAQLTVGSIAQDTLTIGGDYSSLLTPLRSPGDRSVPAVPEPPTFSLVG